MNGRSPWFGAALVLWALALPAVSGASVETRAAGGRIAAADHRQRQNLHVQDQEGYLFHPRPGVQRQEAGAYGGGLRVFDQAFFRSEEPLAVRVPVRGKDRRAR